MLSEIWHCPLYLFPVFLLTTETLLCTNHLCPLPSLHPTLIPFFTTLSLFAAETLLWAKFRTSVIQYSSLHFPHLSPTIVHFNASSYSTVFPMSHIHLLCGSSSLWEYVERKFEGIKTAPKHSVYQRQTYLWVWKVGQLPKKCNISNSQQGATKITINREITTSALIYDLSKHFLNELMGSVVSFEARLRNYITFIETFTKPWLIISVVTLWLTGHHHIYTQSPGFLVTLTS